MLTGPSCTEWCWCNTVIHYAGRGASWRCVNMPLCGCEARDMGRKQQLVEHCWFVIENPPFSALFNIPEFQSVWTIKDVHAAISHGFTGAITVLWAITAPYLEAQALRH